MLRRHRDLSETDPVALAIEAKALSAKQAKKAQEIRNEMKALRQELASLVGADDIPKNQGQGTPPATQQE
jgi:hypothetical protein